ncbi:MAG: hypothetical protein R3190_18010, partial [Thermoanaerobaculia bacterium]|nr:hypothetical protein [Thermoanaerobaculia bacterium]
LLREDGSGDPREISGRLRAVDVLDTGAASLQSLFDGSGNLTGELTDLVDPLRLAAALEAAINGALAKAGLGDYQVAIGTDGGSRLSFDVTATPGGDADDTLEIRFAEPIRVEAGGGRLSLSAPPAMLTLQDLQPGFNVDRRMQVEADFADPAFQDLGIASSPTPFDGVLADDVEFTLLVNGTAVPVSMAASVTSDNTTIDDGDAFAEPDELIRDLQQAIDVGLVLAGFDPGTVEAVRLDPGGNRVGLRSNVEAAVPVEKLSIQVPSELSGGGSNGAVTGLGFASGEGESKRAKASDFFLENVSFEGGFAAFAGDVSASAKIGFLAVTATLEPTLDSATGRFLEASVDLALMDPLDGDARLDVATLAEAISDGQFLFDAAQVGDTNPDPDEVDPGTGFLLGSISGGVGLSLGFAPDGALAGLPAQLDASLDVFIQSPNWLEAPLALDPLGFGFEAREFDGATSSELGAPAPVDGVLAQDLRLILSNDGGASEAIATILAEDTSGNTGTADLVAQIQAALDLALASLGESAGAVSVALGPGSEPALVFSGDAGLSLRGPVSFRGPDFDDILAQLGDLSLADMLDA